MPLCHQRRRQALRQMKICLFRLSAIGDATHALTVVREIQRQSPQSEITWVIGKLEHKLMAGLDGVEFIEFNKSEGFAAIRALRRMLKGRRFDVLLQMQVAFRANMVSTVIRADRRIGYDKARSKDLHGAVINERIAAGSRQHVIEAMQSFLVPIGLTPASQLRWDIPLKEADYSLAADYIDTTRKTLTICPVSSHKLRNWSIERYAAAADHAARTHNMQVLLSGGPSEFESEFNAAVADQMESDVENLTGKDTLKQLTALLEQSDLVLVPDTGPSHIANAVGTDVIGLHAATNPYRSGPYGQAGRCANQYPEMIKTFMGKDVDDVKWGTRLERPGVMDLITVEQVTGKIDDWAKDNP